ncbi:hypothetical protein Marky_0588 [Marinithermus hydrothermalis DSM 14884]|uniref:Uncharacterized protein n=2 Tax=Marinithermus TaxID=186191 RepID=F2NNW4_MARHT|nr:hypothetical protein Marky_0588 [Marinithermus hydrothermalis DSM 14884]
MFNGERSLRVRARAQRFEIPPIRDALLIGRLAPIGPEAARRMAEAIAPGQYTLLRVEGDAEPVEAILVRKAHLRFLDGKHLARILLEEFAQFISPEDVLRVDIELEILLDRTLSFS